MSSQTSIQYTLIKSNLLLIFINTLPTFLLVTILCSDGLCVPVSAWVCEGALAVDALWKLEAKF